MKLQADGWPRLLRQVVGRQARLIADVQRRDGMMFKRGELVTIKSHWKGKLTIDSEARGRMLHCPRYLLVLEEL